MIEADVELSDLLAHLVEEACALAGAQYGALGVLNESRTSLAEFITCGLSEEKERAIGSRPTGRGVLGAVVADGENLRLDRIADHPLSVGFPEGHPAMSSFLGVPVRTPSTVYGNLYLTNKLDAERFSEDDEALVEALAQAAAIAIENNRLRERLRLMSVIEDRDRIARELHDRIIQRIYAIGLALQEASRFAIRDETKAAIARGVDQLDIVINELRATIHQLDHDPLPGGLRRNATELINELAPMLGSRPTLTFAGPIDTTIPLRVADHLLAVLREALTNVAKHAHAQSCAVEIALADGDIALRVTDDGVGIGSDRAGAGLGLANLEQRAAMLGGTFSVQAVEPRGTRLTWRVALGAA
ncbi:MAG: hypothetical protein B7Z69_00665 [Actinobacteria bacterium 21-73-9]|nr:MAG: hypothetical protein B7Z69_00665 [Actinobacteria bacterium 21-73-9]